MYHLRTLRKNRALALRELYSERIELDILFSDTTCKRSERAILPREDVCFVIFCQCLHVLSIDSSNDGRKAGGRVTN